MSAPMELTKQARYTFDVDWDLLRSLGVLPALNCRDVFERNISKRLDALIFSDGVSLPAIRLYMVLASRMSRKVGCCYPAISTLATDAGCSIQYTRKMCRFLEREGFIQIVPKASKYGTNVYYLDFRDLRPIETIGSVSLTDNISGETTVSQWPNSRRPAPGMRSTGGRNID